MIDAVHKCVHQCSWKLQSILRTRRYYTTAQMINLYKAHILSYIEYRTPAISHASATTLAPLDRIQARLLRELDLSPEEALMDYRLAPLHSRRDIAILGVIHRAARKEGPIQLQELFPLQLFPAENASHPYQIVNIASDCDQDYMCRTAFGYIEIYNRLPYNTVFRNDMKKIRK